MRHLMIIAAAATMLGLATPAMADDPSGSLISMQRALYIANRIGVVGIDEIQFYDGKWEIEGRDPAGRDINVDIDSRTGEILNVDRW